VVAEAVLNLACVGARPVALVDCMNFGNPEHPEVMWQLSEAIDGMAEACRALGVPVVGGNVSLYNESRGADIDPTPIVGLLGVVDRLERPPPGATLVEGGSLVLLGQERAALAGSRWAWELHGCRGGELPALDLDAHREVAVLVRDLVVDGLLQGVHDVSDGGIGVAVAEMAVQSAVGARIAILDHVELFGEAPSRVLACVDPARLVEIQRRAAPAGVPVAVIGAAGGDRLVIEGLVDLAVTEAAQAWRDRIPVALSGGATH
jgi:phosphoribosylformylglycinamidine synthase